MLLADVKVTTVKAIRVGFRLLKSMQDEIMDSGVLKIAT